MNTKPDIQLNIINITEVEMGSREIYITQIVKQALQKSRQQKFPAYRIARSDRQQRCLEFKCGTGPRSSDSLVIGREKHWHTAREGPPCRTDA